MRLRRPWAMGLLIGTLAPAAWAQATSGAPRVDEEVGGRRFTSAYMDVTFSRDHPALLSLSVDSLGRDRVGHNVLSAEAAPSAAYIVTRNADAPGFNIEYTRAPGGPGANPDWTFNATDKEIYVTSEWQAGRIQEPLVLTFDTRLCYATLLGLFLDDHGDIGLPAVLHLPGFGTLRLTSEGRANSSVGYASGKGWIRVTFPAADAAHPRVEYRWDVTTIFPEVAGTAVDARYDGFRRNWLNIFQLNPNRLVLANNTNSDTCGFCYYEYADIALKTPPLADNLYALDMVRQTLERVFGGMKAYGMPGYGGGDFPVESSDTAPSLLIAALDYVEGRGDNAWLRAHYPALRAIADKMLATDTDGDGLVKYVASGNSGSWNEGQPKVRPSNWWDTVGFGHEDAYANALAYRALQGMGRMAGESGYPADSARYAAAAAKMHGAYFKAFYDSATGVLAGWRSADGAIHDYYFTFVNGIAVLYGLVPPDRAGGIMDRLWEKMQKVGYTDFRMGLPGNLIPVARKDYAHLNPRYGGGVREDNADGFQIYENGGATACFSYFTIAAFDCVGQHERAGKILLPILGAFDRREFEGIGPNKLTNDWRKWDGTAEGYEGFLTDNYYALLAVPGP
jgi:Bacterial alpha-L-rhamnosidase 6 hairpin glycosidase domain